MHKPAFKTFVLAICMTFILLCLYTFSQSDSQTPLWQLNVFTLEQQSALKSILKDDQLTMITQNNANTFYIYRDQYMGFEYDLAHAFARCLGVSLRVITPQWNEMIPALHSEKGDFIAAGLTITEERQSKVDFTVPYMVVQQMVILHKDRRNIQSLQDLNGLTIHVRENTSYQARLEELQKQGLDISIKLHPNLPTEELIRLVSQKTIPATIADSNIALLNRRYYPEVRMAFPIAEKQSLGWAVRPEDQALLQAMNEFLSSIRADGTYAQIYQKYYANVAIFDYVDLRKYHQRLQTRLPNFKSTIQQEAEKYGFDWRLIAAMIYQESHFNPQATSHTGVRGLMQVTLDTAAEMGIDDRVDPEQSIHAGVKYLSKLYDRFESLSSHTQRLRFALASYNIGYGHVRDAQRLARKQGRDPKKWSTMQEILPLLRQPKYYEQTRYGYARGTEPVRYVKRIFTYYDILRQKADPTSSTASLNHMLQEETTK